MEKRSRADSPIYLGILLIVFLAISSTLALKLNVKVDEEYSLHTSSRTLVYAIDQAINFELQAPGYFMILNLWTRIHDSVFFSRVLSILIILASILLLYKTSPLYLKKVPPIYPAAIFALNPFTLYYATDIRSYALVMLVSLVLLYWYYYAYLVDEPKLSARLIFIFLSVISLSIHYYIGIYLAACGFTLIVLQKFTQVRKYLIDMALPMASLIVYVPFITGQFEGHDSNNIDHSIVQGLVALPGWLFETIDHFMIGPRVARKLPLLLWASRLLLVLMLGYAFVIAWSKSSKRIVIHSLSPILVITASSFLLYSLIFVVLGKVFVDINYLAPAFIPLILTFFYFVGQYESRKLTLGTSGYLVAIYMVGMFMFYRPMVKHFDYRGIMTYIMEQEDSEQAILLYPNYHKFAFQRYYQGKNKLIPVTKELDLDKTWDIGGEVLKNDEELEVFFDSLTQEYNEFWVVNMTKEKFIGTNINKGILNDYLDKYCTTVEDKIFFKNMRVRLVRYESNLLSKRMEPQP